MVIRRGEIWWAEFDAPRGSEAGFPRPVIIVQSDAANASRIGTTIAIPLTSVMTYRHAASNVLLSPEQTGLLKPSLAVTTLIDTLNKSELTERVGALDLESMYDIEAAVLRTLDIDR